MRGATILVVLGLGCGPSVEVEDAGSGSTTSDGSSTSGMGSTTTAIPSTTTDPTAPPPLDLPEATGGSSGEPEDLLVEPERTYYEVQCPGREQGPRLWIEAYPTARPLENCLPSPEAGSDFIVIMIADWDGRDGAFEFGGESPHRAAIGAVPSEDFPMGTVSVTTNGSYDLATADVELANQDTEAVGLLRFDLCTDQAPGPRPC